MQLQNERKPLLLNPLLKEGGEKEFGEEESNHQLLFN
jgi:hypothetical protein